MKMGVLGPLLMDRGGRNRVPNARKPRRLLALLMINAGYPVRASDCVTELWDTSPPKSAASTLQTYVLHLRRMLGEAASGDDDNTLRTANLGYQLAVNPLDVDCFLFEDMARHGAALANANEYEGASEMFTKALDLWRGPVMADVRPGPVSLSYVVELEESRKYVLERRIEADLKLHKHKALLDELETLVRTYPTNENLRAQFMVALYRSGHRAEALSVFRNLRRTLEDNFGFEPDPRIKRLYGAIWAEHPALHLPTAAAR
ncbi:hypothetical protein ALI144C_36680 [Actinosynnema sp. ALI-1.44]|nr:hypothetical protein ALI144C_36680 [Actinosynnema sp. ALI-1.44]